MIKISNKYIKIIFFLAFLSSNVFAKINIRTLYVPMPDLPVSIDPIKSLDVFSNNLIRQIHRGLFKITKSGLPEPDLISSFKIDKSGLLYSFQLAENKFSNDISLESTHVKQSIERAIRSKFNGYQRLSCLKGFKNILNGKTSELNGIKILNKKEFLLDLNCKITRLPYILSDLKLSIILNDTAPEIGLGPYKLIKRSDKNVDLVLVSETSENIFSQISYIKRTEKEIDTEIKNNPEMNFLIFSYSNISNIVDKNLKFETMRSWSNYLVAINSNRIKSKKQRNEIVRLIKRDELVKVCYPGNTVDNNIIPFGFRGYVKDFNYELLKENKNEKKSNLHSNVVIINGVGSEECIKKNLHVQLGSNSKIEIQSAEVAINDWIKNKTDIIFFYLESELNLDVFQFLTLESDFFLGDKSDKSIQMDLDVLQNLDNLTEYNKIATEFQKKIILNGLLVPLFIPRSKIIYSSTIDLPDFGMIPPTYINFSELKFKTNKVKQ